MLLSTARCIAMADHSVGSCISKAALRIAAAEGLEQDADTDAAQVSKAFCTSTFSIALIYWRFLPGTEHTCCTPAAPLEGLGGH